MMKMLILLLGSLLLASPCEAQRTWRVGGLSIPGNDFDEIQHAFDAASAGDAIIVDYNGFVGYSPASTNKGVALLSTNGWTLNASITVHDLPANQKFVIEGFGAPFPFTARNCAGPVHIEGIPSVSASQLPGLGRNWTFDNCTLVTMNGCSLWNVSVIGGRVSAANCAFTGSTSGSMGEIGIAALTMVDAEVTFAGGLILGPDYFPRDLTRVVPAISMQGGVFRFAGKDFQDILQGGFMIPPFPLPLTVTPAIISNGGTVIIDPDVRVLDALTGTARFVTEDMPYMHVSRVFPPGVFAIPIDVYARPFASVFIAISLPAYPLSTVLGDLWLDPSPGGIVLVASGMTDAMGLFSTQSPLNGPWPFGIAPAFQSVIVDQGQIRLSLPVVGVMGFES